MCLGPATDEAKNLNSVAHPCYEGKKFIDFVAKEKPPRPELKHLKEGVSGHVEDVPYGIRTFPEIRCEKRHELEEMMGKKGRIEYLQ